MSQVKYVISSVPERRQMNRKFIETVVKVLPEFSFSIGFLQILIGSNNNANIRRDLLPHPELRFRLQPFQNDLLYPEWLL